MNSYLTTLQSLGIKVQHRKSWNDAINQHINDVNLFSSPRNSTRTTANAHKESSMHYRAKARWIVAQVQDNNRRLTSTAASKHY